MWDTFLNHPVSVGAKWKSLDDQRNTSIHDLRFTVQATYGRPRRGGNDREHDQLFPSYFGCLESPARLNWTKLT